MRRPAIAFRAVNRRGRAGYDPGLQRHHLLPRQLLSRRCFARLFEEIGRSRVGFEDFRRNGLLLPASGDASLRMALPLHRGPHRDYNALVIERVGQVEERWSRTRCAAPARAAEQAILQLGRLQRALRRQLLDTRSRMVLNRHDPLGTGYDFAELDAMAERLWSGTQAVAAASDSRAD